MFANFEKPSIESPGHPAQLYPLSWALIATYAAWTGDRDIVASCAERAMMTTDRGQYYHAVLEAWEALFASQLMMADFDSALHSGLEYARFFTLGPELPNAKAKDWKLTEPINLEVEFKNLEPMILDKWAKAIPTLVLEPILMGLCSLEAFPNISFSKWARCIQDTLGEKNEIVTGE